MATDEGPSLVSLLNKATNPANRDEDWEAIMAFCDQVNKDLEGPSVAVRLLGHKIQSPQERESLYALAALEACVKNCGKRFHQEIGKFRFLNEIIKVVSPKYLGNHTTEKVKTRCVEILYSWSQCLKHEPKIQEAYQMLKKQGIVTKDPTHTDKTFEPPPERPKNKSSIFEDDDKSKLLSRLLKSNHPEDLQAANRLIKNMVKQDAERQEKQSRRTTELETVGNNVKLLTEMLEHFSPAITSASDRDLMKELYGNLEKQRPALFRLASDTDEKDTEGINAILAANDDVLKVMTRYKKLVEGEDNGLLLDTSSSSPATARRKADADLVDLAFDGLAPNPNPPPPPPTSSSVFDDQLMGLDSLLSHDFDFGEFTSSLAAGDSQPPGDSVADLKELGDIFGSQSQGAAAAVNPLDSDPFSIGPTSTVTPTTFTGLSSSPATGNNFSAFISSSSTTSGSATPPPLASQSGAGQAPAGPSLVTPAAAAGSGGLSGMGTPTTLTPIHSASPVLKPAVAGGQPHGDVVTGILSGGTSVLQPTSVSSVTAPAAAGSAAAAQPQKSDKASALDDLDALGRSLLQSSLPPNFKSTAATSTTKMSMSEMQKSSTAAIAAGAAGGNSMTNMGASSANSSPLDGLIQPTSPAVKALAQSSSGASPIATPTGSAHASPKHAAAGVEVQPLTDISVPVESIKPGSVGPLCAYDKQGLKVVVHFGQDSPRPDVVVMVLSTTSSSSEPLRNYAFQAAVPKSMRVKLQPSSTTELPAYNPILPQSAITQVMLIANPQKEKIRLKFKLTCSLGSQNISEVGELDSFPVQ